MTDNVTELKAAKRKATAKAKTKKPEGEVVAFSNGNTRSKTSDGVVHLHWLWHTTRGASTDIAILSSGGAACGVMGLKPDTLTRDLEACTCTACKTVAANRAALPPPPVEVEQPKATRKPSNAPQKLGGGKVANSDDVISWLVPKNPMKPGTKRYAFFDVLFEHNGKTVKEFRAAGGDTGTLKLALATNIVKLVDLSASDVQPGMSEEQLAAMGRGFEMAKAEKKSKSKAKAKKEK